MGEATHKRQALVHASSCTTDEPQVKFHILVPSEKVGCDEERIVMLLDFPLCIWARKVFSYLPERQFLA